MSGEPDGLSPVAAWRNFVRDSGVDPTARLVAFVLSTYMARNGNGAYPSRRTIAKGAGIGVRAVDAAINRLEAAGLLAIERSKGHTSNTYAAAGIPRTKDHVNDDPLGYLD